MTNISSQSFGELAVVTELYDRPQKQALVKTTFRSDTGLHCLMY